MLDEVLAGLDYEPIEYPWIDDQIGASRERGEVPSAATRLSRLALRRRRRRSAIAACACR